MSKNKITLVTKKEDFVGNSGLEWNLCRFIAEFNNAFGDTNDKYDGNIYHDDIYEARNNAQLYWDLDFNMTICDEDGIGWWPTADGTLPSPIKWSWVRDDFVVGVLKRFATQLDGDPAELADKVRKKKLRELDRNIDLTSRELQRLIQSKEELLEESENEDLKKVYVGKWITDNDHAIYHVANVRRSPDSEKPNAVDIEADKMIMCCFDDERLSMDLCAHDKNGITIDQANVRLVEDPMKLVEKMMGRSRDWLAGYIK